MTTQSKKQTLFIHRTLDDIPMPQAYISEHLERLQKEFATLKSWGYILIGAAFGGLVLLYFSHIALIFMAIGAGGGIYSSIRGTNVEADVKGLLPASAQDIDRIQTAIKSRKIGPKGLAYLQEMKRIERKLPTAHEAELILDEATEIDRTSCAEEERAAMEQRVEALMSAVEQITTNGEDRANG